MWETAVKYLNAPQTNLEFNTRVEVLRALGLCQSRHLEARDRLTEIVMEQIRNLFIGSREKLHNLLFLIAVFCFEAGSTGAEQALMSPDHRFTINTNKGISLVDNGTKQVLSFATAEGTGNVRAFWNTVRADRVILSKQERNGFRLFGALAKGDELRKVNVPDPGAELYDLMERNLQIKIGNGKGTYRVYSEELQGVTWTGLSATAHELWSLAENLGEGKKTFKFDVTYEFGENGVRISNIRPAS
jgi:hypothetical protein